MWPAKDIVIAVTGGGFDPGEIAPALLRSLRSNVALPPNPEAYERLLARVRAAAQPPRAEGGSLPPPAPPPLAAAIDGVDYDLDPNPLGVRGMQARFLDGSAAQLRIRLRDTELLVPVGLDGAYRIGVDPLSGDRVAGRGRWTGPNRFVLEIDTIARVNHFTVAIDFAGDQVRGQVSERAGLIGAMALSGRARQ